MRIAWGAVAIAAAVVVSAVGAVIALQPAPVWDDPAYYTYELTRLGPPPGNSEYRWLVTVEKDQVTNAVLQNPPADVDPTSYWIPAVGPLLDYADSDKDVEVTYEDGYPTSVCFRYPANPERDRCEGIAAITPLSAEAARDIRRWQEPASYSVTVRSESVAWDVWKEWRLVVDDGVVTESTLIATSDDSQSADPPRLSVREYVFRDAPIDPHWTTYWRADDPNPGSVCYDDPTMYDEETCHYFSDYEINP